MREKRPRISNYRSNSEIQQNVSDIGTTKRTDGYEDISLVKDKFPGIETNGLWQRDYNKPAGMTDYQREADVIQNDHGKNRQVDFSDDTSFLKDIYDTIDYDHTI